MHKLPIGETPAFGIGRNVCKLISEILTVADAVFVESGLPDFSSILSPHLMRKPALDTLGATFNGLVYGWA
jgi:prolyl-tRNA editing enzyme YbaK/EbsC (Cys-tRNA(Pro) deacylase)